MSLHSTLRLLLKGPFIGDISSSQESKWFLSHISCFQPRGRLTVYSFLCENPPPGSFKLFLCLLFSEMNNSRCSNLLGNLLKPPHPPQEQQNKAGAQFREGGLTAGQGGLPWLFCATWLLFSPSIIRPSSSKQDTTIQLIQSTHDF